MCHLPRLFRLGLISCLLLASSCTSSRYWSKVPPAADSNVLPTKTFRFTNKHSPATILAMPGDLLLMHLGNSLTRSAIKQLGAYPAGLVDVLSLNDPFTTYLHSEIIDGIEPGRRVSTEGFYPIVKQFHGNQYNTSYSIFAVGGQLDNNRLALKKMAEKSYAKTGYCGDFVAWAYDDRIYSWWNQVSGVQDVIMLLYPGEAIHTADKIANSPQTTKLFELLNGQIVYPTEFFTRELLARAERAMAQDDPQLIRHGQAVQAFLRKHGVIDNANRVRIPVLRFEVQHAEAQP